MKFFVVIFCAVLAGVGAGVRATPANKAGLQRHFGAFLGKDLDRCTTCHLPSANKNPEFLDEFPHNEFGKSIRALGKSKSIEERLAAVAKEDADGDGVGNEIELLAGTNPGNAKETPGKKEIASAPVAEFRKFLASYPWRPFEAVKQPAVPRVKNKRWVRNEIDAFVLAQHEARGLKARPEAAKEILLRRVYLDLIGLSPTPAQIEAFLRDDSASAYEKVVDRLLDDARYGERWGRHWLDVWRYSDWAGWSGGNQIRDSKPHIWRWRDWTIEALNRDKGYDEMILEMLAADEFAPNDTNALRATGFLVRNYKMLSREQWLEDTVKHTSQAFMGVTMGCAKCHNHMTEPITQKEYYQFRAIFEPHQVRTDRVPGEVDTGKNGLVRAYDVGTNPPTYFFVRGDERKPETNRVMLPGVPKALKGSFEVMPVILPRSAAYPDNRKFVIEDQVRESEAAIAAAEKEEKHREWKVGIAKTKHETLLALLEHEQRPSTNLAKSIVSLQRRAGVLEAKLKLEQADKDEEKKKAQTKLEEAEKLAASEPDTKFKPRAAEVYPEFSTGRRLALAKWIANRENPLTARVAMNHVWLRHFGQAIVGTPADFGFNGKAPRDAALLDWLAAEFMKRNWSMKEMHRLMVTSSAYRMASTPDAANAKIDPDNVYLWRMPSRRMEGELVRDNLLHVAGDLDGTMGGPDIDHATGLTSKRRSIYLRIAAEKEVEFLKIFDGPSVTECYMRRPSVVPQQALALANSELALREAKALAGRLAEEKDFVEAAYRRILARGPKNEEREMCAEFLAAEAKKSSMERARQNLVLVLFNHNDFVTIR